MRVATKVVTRSISTLTLDDDSEVVLEHEPDTWNEPLVERVGDKLVVAYLVSDADGTGNPMKENDCQGHIYTRQSYRAMDQKVTDNNAEMFSALGLDSDAEPDTNRKFNLDGRKVSLWTLAEEHLMLEDPPPGHDDEVVEAKAVGLYREHWQKLAGPFVVPISYFAERGGCLISPTTWDGDPDDLPDGVWVADAGAEENIRISAVSEPGVEPTFEAMHAAAVKYAADVCSEYASWCEGDCYGIVVETFQKPDDDFGAPWERIDSDSCWGFIGSDWAKKALQDEYFKPAVERLRSGQE